MIFWDEKRPITVAVLRRLSLKEVAKELDVLVQYDQFQYDQWSEIRTATSTGRR